MSTLTFPATRRLIQRALRVRVLGELLLLAALFAASWPYIGLRAIANNGRAAVDGATYESALFGGLPTTWLQDALFSGGYGWFEHFAVYLHASWFIVPTAVSLFVVFRHRDQFGSYALWRLLTTYGVLVGFFLVPMQPPWMADPEVTRILALRWGGGEAIDNNAVAAMPSFHVALPVALAIWAYMHQHKILAVALGAWSAAIGLEVVFLGEHYVIDVLGGVLAATVVAVVGSCFENRSFPLPRRLFVREPAKVDAHARAESQRGQALIEFALLTPVILLFIAAIIVFGLAMNTRASLQQAVREGARQASVGATLGDVQNLAAGNAPDVIGPGDVFVCHPTGSGLQGDVGSPVEVSIRPGGVLPSGYKYKLSESTGVFGGLFGLGDITITMDPKATARLETMAFPVVAC